MARLAEIQSYQEAQQPSSRTTQRKAGPTTAAFWVDGFRGLNELVRAWVAWVVEEVGRRTERRGASLGRAQGFRSNLAAVLAAVGSIVTTALLNSLERLGVWITRGFKFLRTKLADRAFWASLTSRLRVSWASLTSRLRRKPYWK
jgi:hypothetical protein